VYRGDNRRQAELVDLSLLEYAEDEGPTACFAACLCSQSSKTNKSNMKDYNAAMRHKDVRLCTMGALAQYLFWRWHIAEEEPPDFSSHQAWYKLKILVGADRFKPLSYETQADCCAAALAEAGIIADLVTHVCRGSSARLAELLGVPESEVSTLGLSYHAVYALLTPTSTHIDS
jgi:hypothetical protein